MTESRFPVGQLGDFLRLRRGFDLPSRMRKPGGIPVISSSGTTGYHNQAKVQGPGVITGRYGTLGEVFYSEGPFWPLNTALYVDDFRGNHPRFAFYFLRTLGLHTRNAAGAVPGVNRNVLHKLPVRFPPRSVQVTISDILSSYDDLIENNSRRMDLLEEAIHLLFREWFIYLRFPGYRRVERVDGVPGGWRKRPAGEVVDFNPSTLVTKDVVRPYVPMASLSTTSMRLTEIDERVPKGGARFRNHDTLLARITPSLENGKTGFVDFLPSDEESATGSTEFIVMRGRGVPPTWVYCLARSAGFRQYAIQNLTGSDGRQRVSKGALERLEILVPPEEPLAEWEALASPMFEQIRTLTTENERLREARDLLLPRLMDGRIPV